MKTIYLHGYLHDLHPDPILVEAQNVAEAIRSLSLIPALEPKDGKLHPIEIDGVDSEISLYSENGIDEIHVYPRSGGAGGRGGFMQIILGIALIAVSFALPAAGFGAAGFLSSGSVFMAGAMMALGGVLQLLAPTPGDVDQEESSKYLPSSGNTVKIGTPIPILYGTSRAAGHYLTFDVDSKGVVGDATGGNDLNISGQGRSWDARAGLGEFSEGDFSYNFYKIPPGSGLFDESIGALPQFPPEAPWQGYAKGYTDEVNPGALHEVLNTESPGYIAVYRGALTIPTTGDWEFFGASEFTLKDPLGVPVASSGGAFSLTAGETYEVSMWFFSSFDLPELGAVLTPPTLRYSRVGNTPGVIPFNSLPSLAPEEVVLQNSRYVTYDRTVLQNDFAVLRPIYASATPGQTNIPVSDWSVS